MFGVTKIFLGDVDSNNQILQSGVFLDSLFRAIEVVQNRGVARSGEQKCPIAREEGHCFCGKFRFGQVIRRRWTRCKKGCQKVHARAVSADGNLIATGALIAIALAFIRRMSIKDGFSTTFTSSD